MERGKEEREIYRDTDERDMKRVSEGERQKHRKIYK